MKTTIVTLLILLTVAAPASALTRKTAETSVHLAAEQTFAAFSETKPVISAKCRIDRRFHAVCTASYRGDRLNAKFRATVVERVDGYVVRFSRLDVKR